jgi:hypothetical protein
MCGAEKVDVVFADSVGRGSLTGVSVVLADSVGRGSLTGFFDGGSLTGVLPRTGRGRDESLEA